MIELSLWLWLWLECETVVHGLPAAVDWAPKQQKNEENMFRLLGFLEIEPGTVSHQKKLVNWVNVQGDKNSKISNVLTKRELTIKIQMLTALSLTQWPQSEIPKQTSCKKVWNNVLKNHLNRWNLAGIALSASQNSRRDDGYDKWAMQWEWKSLLTLDLIIRVHLHRLIVPCNLRYNGRAVHERV